MALRKFIVADERPQSQRFRFDLQWRQGGVLLSEIEKELIAVSTKFALPPLHGLFQVAQVGGDPVVGGLYVPPEKVELVSVELNRLGYEVG
jgi:hypothetical protein